jgi:CheY-specific phosphatase CheX
MQKNKLIADLFRSVDDKNAEEMASFLDQSCLFRFGNLPAVTGVEEIRNFVSGFFDSIHSLKHECVEVWDISCGTVCHGTVSYTRHDMSVLTVPFSNIFTIKNDKIYEYLIFADTSHLYSS